MYIEWWHIYCWSMHILSDSRVINLWFLISIPESIVSPCISIDWTSIFGSSISSDSTSSLGRCISTPVNSISPPILGPWISIFKLGSWRSNEETSIFGPWISKPTSILGPVYQEMIHQFYVHKYQVMVILFHFLF